MVLRCIKVRKELNSLDLRLSLRETAHFHCEILKTPLINNSKSDCHGIYWPHLSDEPSNGLSVRSNTLTNMSCNIMCRLPWNLLTFRGRLQLILMTLRHFLLAYAVWQTVVYSLIICRLQHQRVHCVHVQRVLHAVHWLCAKGQTTDEFAHCPSSALLTCATVSFLFCIPTGRWFAGLHGTIGKLLLVDLVINGSVCHLIVRLFHSSWQMKGRSEGK